MLSSQGYLDKNILLTALDSPFLDSARVFPYLGVLYLAAVGQQLGLNPVYLCFEDYPLAETKFQESNLFYTDEFRFSQEGDIGPKMYEPFDLIGISCQTPQFPQAVNILRTMKGINPSVRVIIGGPHATHYTEECKAVGFDVICRGDGERIFQAILQGDTDTLARLRDSLSSETILVLRDQLDEQEMDKYLPVRQSRYLERYHYQLADRPATTLVNSRGCPFRCTFCEHGISTKRGRWHSVDHFAQEISSIIALGFRGVMIFDDLFAISPQKVKPYLDILAGYHQTYDLTFRCFGHANVVARHPEILEMLASAGCVEIGFGAESASQRMLDNINKRTKVEDLHGFVEKAVGAGINVKAFFMMGLPGETPGDFAQTKTFIEQHRVWYPNRFDFDLAVFYPYRGSEIGNLMRSNDYQSVPLRLRSGLTWDVLDRTGCGAYKQKGGGSDTIAEPYDWETGKILFPAEAIEHLKEETMTLSQRYAPEGSRIFTPQIEGSIGAGSEGIKSALTLEQIEESLAEAHGWTTFDEGRALYSLAQGCSGQGVIVEIGSYMGRSTIWLAHGSKAGNNVKIYAIDPHTGDPQTWEARPERWTYDFFLTNIKAHGVDDIITPMVMTSEQATQDVPEPVELVFIDGDHRYEFARLDFDLWFPKVISGGLIALHDAMPEAGWPGPNRVVEESIRGSPQFVWVAHAGSIVYAKKL